MNADRAEQAAASTFLGLDVGSRRIGVAASDALHLLAHPLLTLTRGRPRDDLRSIARLARRHNCGAYVVGHPLHLSGEGSAQAAKTEAFARELHALHPLAVYLWDERLTSHEAHSILYAAGRPRQAHRAVVDQLAATLILQSFLDAIRTQPTLLAQPFLPAAAQHASPNEPSHG